MASIRVFAYRDQVTLSYRRSGLGGEWEDVKEPLPLEWTPCNFGGERPLVHLPWGNMRPEGGYPVRAGEVLPV